jgi:hypothetical protein
MPTCTATRAHRRFHTTRRTGRRLRTPACTSHRRIMAVRCCHIRSCLRQRLTSPACSLFLRPPRLPPSCRREQRSPPSNVPAPQW